jgi:glutamate-1-semialdehyde 2,1-aminomutase
MKAYFIQLMLDQEFLASSQYYAMYAHTKENVDAYLEAVDNAFAEIASAVSRGNLVEKLIGKPSSVGFMRLA